MSARQNSRTPDMAELIRLAVAQAQGNIHTGLPGRIESYDVGEQKADIKPLLRRPLVASDGTELAAESLPILMDVPIHFARGGGGFLSFPLAKGDLVHLFFVERSMDQWLDKNGEETTPADFRMHSLADAVAYPGLYPRKASLSDAHADNLVWGFDGGAQVHIKPNGEVHLASENAADFVALAALVLSRLEAVETDFTTMKTILATHFHPSGVGPTGPPTPPGDLSTFTPSSPASVAASKVKAD